MRLQSRAGLANIAAVSIRKNETAATRQTPTLRTSDAETGRHAGLTSGRVSFDERGNAKWQMRTSGHSFSDGSTTLVRKLVPPLSLEPTVRVPKLMPASAPKGQLQPKPEVKAAISLDKSLEEGLQKTAGKVVEACPTGALANAEK